MNRDERIDGLAAREIADRQFNELHWRHFQNTLLMRMALRRVAGRKLAQAEKQPRFSRTIFEQS